MSFMLLGILNSQAAGGAGGPAYDLIETVEATSPVSSISFSGIPSDYKHLEIRYLAVGSSDGGIPNMYFNGDTASNYSSHVMTTIGTTRTAGSNTNDNKINIGGYNVGNENSLTLPFLGVVSITDANSTTKYKTSRAFYGITESTASNSEVGFWSGNWRSTSAITSINFGLGGINWAVGARISLYGVK